MHLLKPMIVVCGATGNQGGAVVAALLLTRRYDVTALTRDPGSVAALALGRMGANVVRADLLDVSSLLSAFSGADGVFGVTQPWNYSLSSFDIKAELRQAKNIIWASRQAGVKEVILSTVLNLNNKHSGVSWIDSKRTIEQLFHRHIPNGVLVRPALYMQNIGTDMIRIAGYVLKGRFDADTKVPYIDLQDLGRCVLRILDSPEYFRGKILHLPGDLTSGKEIASKLAAVHDKCVYRYRSVSELYLRIFKPRFFRMRRFFERQGGLLDSILTEDDELMIFFSDRMVEFFKDNADLLAVPDP